MKAVKYPFPTEPDHQGDPYREAYLDGLRRWTSAEMNRAEEERKEFFGEILERPEEYRRKFIQLLGWPLTERKGPVRPKAVFYPGAEVRGVTMERVQLEVLPGVPYYGLLFRQGRERRPLVVAQHGAGGTPELCSGLLERGTVNYNDMVGRILQYGVHVFAPQTLMWDPAQFQTNGGEGEAICQARREEDQALKLLGGSMAAVELTCLMGALDYFETQDYVRPDQIGMVGLSYGGFYTLYAAAVETRIKSALSSCFFNRDHYRLGSDYILQNAGRRFLDSEIAMLARPRKLSIQIGREDDLLPAAGGEQEYRRLREYAGKTEQDWLRFTVFPGEHEFWKDDAPLVQLIRDLEEV